MLNYVFVLYMMKERQCLGRQSDSWKQCFKIWKNEPRKRSGAQKTYSRKKSGCKMKIFICGKRCGVRQKRMRDAAAYLSAINSSTGSKNSKRDSPRIYSPVSRII